MRKQGPCCHCGVPSTPLWRNGPPEKPILCNACGSRWRTKGSLTNYIPLHARAESDNLLNNKASSVKIVSYRDKESSLLKRKRTYENVIIGNFDSNYSDSFLKTVDDDDDGSYRSSSGSAVSNSESFAQLDASYVHELTGYSRSFGIEADISRTGLVKKRASFRRPKSSSIATLTKDLCTILQQQQSSGFYGSVEDDLLFESGKSMFSANETCSYSKRLYTSDTRIVGVSTDFELLQQEKTDRNNKLPEVSESYGSHSSPYNVSKKFNQETEGSAEQGNY